MFTDVIIFICQNVIGRISVIEAIHVNLIHHGTFCPSWHMMPGNNHKFIILFHIFDNAAKIIDTGKLSRTHLKIVRNLFIIQFELILIPVKKVITFILHHQMFFIFTDKVYFINIIFCCTEFNGYDTVRIWIRGADKFG